MYARFADVYDSLMDDFDYTAWAAYYLKILKNAGVEPGSICDCGCGTGAMAVEFKRAGVDVTGVDLSEDMLEKAGERARLSGLSIPFVRQDMRALTLHRPVDAIVSACDCVNYLLTDAELARFFDRAFAQLRPGGALAFDFSTARKFRRMTADGAYCEEREGVAYLWFNAPGSGADTIDMELTFFVRRPDSLYERFEERQTQRAHTIKKLEALLRKSGFSAVRAYGDRTENSPSPEENRVHMTAVKL